MQKQATSQQKGNQKSDEFDNVRTAGDEEDPEEAVSARSTDPLQQSQTETRRETKGHSHLLDEQEKQELPSTIMTPFQRRFRKIPRKTLCTSVTFLTVGFALFIVGIVCFFNCDERKRAFGFMGTGALLLLPGGYSSFILVQYLRGERGYSPNQIPQFE